MKIGIYNNKSVAMKTKKALNDSTNGFSYSVRKLKSGYALYRRKK